MPRMGRPSIFGSRVGGDRVQGDITKIGSQRFEQARARLARLAGWDTEKVSDADTIEYLSRGHAATAKYLKGRK